VVHAVAGLGFAFLFLVEHLERFGGLGDFFFGAGQARKVGLNEGTYCASRAGVSRAGSMVTNSTCTLLASGPRRFSVMPSSPGWWGRHRGNGCSRRTTPPPCHEIGQAAALAVVVGELQILAPIDAGDVRALEWGFCRQILNQSRCRHRGCRRSEITPATGQKYGKSCQRPREIGRNYRVLGWGCHYKLGRVATGEACLAPT